MADQLRKITNEVNLQRDMYNKMEQEALQKAGLKFILSQCEARAKQGKYDYLFLSKHSVVNDLIKKQLEAVGFRVVFEGGICPCGSSMLLGLPNCTCPDNELSRIPPMGYRIYWK